MASRRRYEPLQPEIKQFTLSEIGRGIDKLSRRIKEVQALDPRIVPYDDARRKTVESDLIETIREVFGPRSPEFLEHGYHRISHGSVWTGSAQELQNNFAAGIPQTTTMLQGLIARLEEKRAEALPESTPAIPPRPVPGSSRQVFVVHGRDEATKLTVTRFLEKLDLEPIILHERSNEGRTLIDKFEQNADVGFAVVLLTPDDEGHPTNHPDDNKPRARQNVILELGYFIGRITRARVCALYKGGVELPSDFDGVVYVSWDDPQSWQLLLAREIKAAGIDVDLNRAI